MANTQTAMVSAVEFLITHATTRKAHRRCLLGSARGKMRTPEGHCLVTAIAGKLDSYLTWWTRPWMTVERARVTTCTSASTGTST